MSLERLQKIIAQAGLASRRRAEELISAGKVRVNGQIVRTLGVQADAERDRIEVDNQLIRVPRKWTYLVLNKPIGVVTTARDELGRATVVDLIGGVGARLFPVGRLDYDAEGTLLLTNDGDLAAALTHPAGEIPKIYRAKVRGVPNEDTLTRLLTGITLEDGLARVQAADVVRMGGPRESAQNAWVQLTVTEGRNHLVKRLLEAVGHPVIRLRRTSFAGLSAEGLEPGGYRPLNVKELKDLRAQAAEAKAKIGEGRGERPDPKFPPAERPAYQPPRPFGEHPGGRDMRHKPKIKPPEPAEAPEPKPAPKARRSKRPRPQRRPS